MKVFIDDIGKCDIVWDSVKVGFPEHDIIKIERPDMAHHEVIQRLIVGEEEPFWIVDTDVIFYDKMPDPPPSTALFGEYQQPFLCPITGKHTQPRLNPACMCINPEIFFKDLRRLSSSLTVPQYTPPADPVAPVIIGPYFFDILAAAYYQVSITSMQPKHLKSFVHLHCGSWLDTAEQYVPGLKDIHARAKTDPASLRGIRHIQREFYLQHAPTNY
jgi:hypothetical protein